MYSWQTRFDEVTIGPAMEAERPVFGNGILLNYSDSWRPRRDRIQRHLSARGVQRFGDMMIRRAVRQFSGFGKEIDVGHEMLTLTLGVVVEALFSQEADRALPTIENLVSAHHRYFERVVTGSSPSGDDERLNTAVHDMHALVDSMIEDRRARGSLGNDLFGALLACKDDAGEPLDDETIRDEAITLILPGHETTATTLTWAISLLGRNAEVLASFERQIDDALDRQLPTVGVLTSIPLARQIILETLRLYPGGLLRRSHSRPRDGARRLPHSERHGFCARSVATASRREVFLGSRAVPTCPIRCGHTKDDDKVLVFSFWRWSQDLRREPLRVAGSKSPAYRVRSEVRFPSS
jgi:cytochrome P450